MFSQRYERGSTLVTSNLPFDEWTTVFGADGAASFGAPPYRAVTPAVRATSPSRASS